MKVVEKFTSINGEGTRAGELAVFIRFKGCNLRCSYCDTMWANEPECPYKEETPEEILNYVLGTGIHNVTLTGGEPLLQKDIRDLIHLLLQAGLQVEIETNGAVDLAAFCEERPVFTMDYKLPSSGCEDHMITENMELLEKNDTVKFVSGSQEDLLKALELIRTYDQRRAAERKIRLLVGERNWYPGSERGRTAGIQQEIQRRYAAHARNPIHHPASACAFLSICADHQYR